MTPAVFVYTLLLIATISNMTTYIPSLTLPSAIFENAAVSVLLPIAAGTAVGFSTQRKTNYLQSEHISSSI